MKKIYLLILSYAVFVVSCGGKYDRDPTLSGKTKVYFQKTSTQSLLELSKLMSGNVNLLTSLNTLTLPSNMSGAKLILFAQDTSDGKIKGRKVLDSSGSAFNDFSWTITNGTYKFFALSWGGGGTGAESWSNSSNGGDLFCGVANSGNEVVLDGTPESVSISLSSACSEIQIHTISSLLFCGTVSTGFPVTGSVGGCGDTFPSSSSSSRSTVQSIQFRIHELDEFSGQGFNFNSYLNATCQNSVSVTGGSQVSANGMKSFSGSSDLKPMTELVLFSDTNCTTAIGLYSFSNGLNSANGTSAAKVRYHHFSNGLTTDASTSVQFYGNILIIAQDPPNNSGTGYTSY